MIATESGTIGGTPAATQGVQTPAQQPGTPSKSGNFTNLQSYLDVNKGNDKALGERVTGVVNNNAQQATGAVGTYADKAKQSVAGGTVKDAGIIDAVKSVPQNVDKPTFQKQYNATYTGIDDATKGEGYDDAITKTNKVTTEANLAGGGLSDRASLLKDAYQEPRYSRGEQNLDSFLLGSGEDGSKAVQGIQDTYKNFGSGLDTARNDVTGAIQAGKAATQKTKDDTQAAYGSTLKGVTDNFDNLKSSVATKNVTNDQTYKDTLTGLSSGDAEARKAAYQTIGLDFDSGEWLRSKGYDPAKIISKARDQSLGDVTNDQDVQKYQSLLGLLDSGSTYDFSKAGGTGKAFDARGDQITAAKGAVGYEAQMQKKLADAEAARQAEYEAYKNSLGGYDAATATKAGLSPDELARAQALGVNLSTYATRGKALGVGDAASDDDRTKYGDLLKTLGISSNTLADTQDEGAAAGFDRGGYTVAYNNRAADYVKNMGTPSAYGTAPRIDENLLGNIMGIDPQQLAGTSLLARSSRVVNGLDGKPKTIDEGWAVPEMDPANFFANTPNGPVFDKDRYVSAANAFLAKNGSTRRIK